MQAVSSSYSCYSVFVCFSMVFFSRLIHFICYVLIDLIQKFYWSKWQRWNFLWFFLFLFMFCESLNSLSWIFSPFIFFGTNFKLTFCPCCCPSGTFFYYFVTVERSCLKAMYTRLKKISIKNFKVRLPVFNKNVTVSKLDKGFV